MGKLSKHINKEELQEIFKLYSKQSWLCDKEDRLLELLLFCETPENKKLVIQLLNEFHFLDSKTLSVYLSLIADYIVTDSGFSEDTSQIAAITYDDKPDSSQKVLDYIKIPIFNQGWADPELINHYSNAIRAFNKGRKEIIFIDEFVGSGQTILNRIKQLRNDIGDNFKLKFCFIAGMDYGIKKIEKLGFEVFCPLRLQQGISERYVGKDLIFVISIMYELEDKLAQKINTYDLKDYSFGFNGAEALYSLEGCQGNTPNSVFPIFWWPSFYDSSARQTILTRFERGLK